MWGFLLIVCLILVAVTICVTIVTIYLQLQHAEDYRWQWTCLGVGASTALYVYVYAAYYFVTKTQMYGALQTGYFFGYMAVFATGMAILCGTIAYHGGNFFVRLIYGGIKAE